jgi:peptidoglycan hydrolase-like protein with peptidoglycan-binding domain
MSRRHLLLLVVLIVAAIAILVALDRGGGGHHPKPVTIHVDRSVKPGVQPTTITVPEKAVDKVGTPADAEHQLAHPTKAIKAKVPGQIRAAKKAARKIRATKPPLPVAGAAISVPGCRTMFIHSYSSRHGVRPTQFWLHYTASPNITGWGDVLSIVHYFTTVEASSHFVLDREGHCAYIVPIEQKAWTQMAANAFGINFEIIDTGREKTYLDPAGETKLRAVLHYLSRVTGIPLRKGAVAGCSPTRSGIVTHWMGGLCSGGHVDLKPFDITHEIAKLVGTTTPASTTAPATLPLLACTATNLQRRLGVTADGAIGPKTRAAIAALQLKHHWRVTGRAGPLVGGALRLKGCAL